MTARDVLYRTREDMLASVRPSCSHHEPVFQHAGDFQAVG
jgi:hypothetical protein